MIGRQLTAQPAGEMPGGVGMFGARPGHELFIASLPPESFKAGADILDKDGMIAVIS
jgi:hypothetical protein